MLGCIRCLSLFLLWCAICCVSVCVISRFDFIFYRREILFAKDKWVKCVYSKVIPIKWRTWRFMNEKKVPPCLLTETAEKAFPPLILWAYFFLISSVETLQQPWLPDKLGPATVDVLCPVWLQGCRNTERFSSLVSAGAGSTFHNTCWEFRVCELWISRLTTCLM